MVTPIDELGLAITDAGIVWTDRMRAAWDAAKDAEAQATREGAVLKDCSAEHERCKKCL